MAFDVLVCPNCKGHLQADTSKGIAICPNCGTQINMVERISIDGIPGVQTHIDRGEGLFACGKYEEANQAYKDALILDPKNCEAFYGRYLCEMKFAEYYGFRDDYGHSGPMVEANIRLNLLKSYLIPARDFALEPVKSQLSVLVNEETETIERLSSGESQQQKKSSGCYIATAVYGSYYAPQVISLRHFRDTVLAKSFMGRLFIKTYYAISPHLAKHLNTESNISICVRKCLDRFILMINK